MTTPEQKAQLTAPGTIISWQQAQERVRQGLSVEYENWPWPGMWIGTRIIDPAHTYRIPMSAGLVVLGRC